MVGERGDMTVLQRAAIAYDADTKRMRIGYSHLDLDGNRTEIWVSFNLANYPDGLRERIARHDGPEEGARTVKDTALAWDTRIEELNSSELGTLSKDAYKVWSSHFGPATINPQTERQNKKRRERDHTKRGTKRQRTSTNSPIPTIETTHPTSDLNDEQLAMLFYKFDSPFSMTGYTRIAEILKSVKGLSVTPPVEVFLSIRQKAEKYAPEPPTLIWGDMEYQAWLKDAHKQEKHEDKDQPLPNMPGVANTTLNPTVPNFDLLERFRARWASKGRRAAAVPIPIMAQQRAAIAFADDTKRVRIALSVLGDDGKRKPIWVSYNAANYQGTLRERIARFEGRGLDATTIKEDQVAWDTRIKELQDAEPGKLSKAAYELWKSHFGPAIVDPVSERNNSKRRLKAQEKSGSSKKPRMTSESPLPTTEVIDTTDLTDDQLVKTFYSYEQDVGADGLHRMSKLLRVRFGSATAIPASTLARMRKDAITYVETPQLIWTDPQFLAWKSSAIKKEKETVDFEVQAQESGIAHAELRTKINKTWELFNAYRARWSVEQKTKSAEY